MAYFLSFLEGVATFISPCLLPLLPIYISFLVGQKKDNAIKNSVAFVFGFSIVFILLGIFASSVGVFLKENQTVFNIVSGFIVIIFGLNFMQVINIPFLNYTKKLNYKRKNVGVFSSFIFGIVFSIGWTPCVGAFLGSALMLAAHSKETLKGFLMLLFYSLGLGIPFIISAILVDKLKNTFDFIKRNYNVITLICGVILVLIGIAMATGYMGYYLSLLTF